MRCLKPSPKKYILNSLPWYMILCFWMSVCDLSSGTHLTSLFVVCVVNCRMRYYRPRWHSVVTRRWLHVPCDELLGVKNLARVDRGTVSSSLSRVLHFHVWAHGLATPRLAHCATSLMLAPWNNMGDRNERDVTWNCNRSDTRMESN